MFTGHLRPSRELLEYYRKKIAEFDTEHDDMLHRLEAYKVTYEEQVCVFDVFISRAMVPISFVLFLKSRMNL